MMMTLEMHELPREKGGQVGRGFTLVMMLELHGLSAQLSEEERGMGNGPDNALLLYAIRYT